MDSVTDSIENQCCTEWLQQLNGCAGVFGGLLLQKALALPYVAWLQRRAELTNPPCPGLTSDANCFLMLVQVNCSNKMALAGTAGNTHRNGDDDTLSYLVAIHASVLRRGSEQGLMLFPSLRCAVRLRPSLVLVFQGIEPH
jgi:hypothetical protein